MMIIQNNTNKNPEEILTTSPVIIVEENITMQETDNYIHRQNQMRMQKHLEK